MNLLKDLWIHHVLPLLSPIDLCRFQLTSKHCFNLTETFQPLLNRWKQLINTKTNDKCLREAALTGHMDLIKLFIKRGATKWDWGLHSAAIRGDRALVDFFISKGAHNWDEAIEAAAQGNHKDLIHFFQSQIEGPDIEFNTLSKCDSC